jgi:hypothetical protein
VFFIFAKDVHIWLFGGQLTMGFIRNQAMPKQCLTGQNANQMPINQFLPNCKKPTQMYIIKISLN